MNKERLFLELDDSYTYGDKKRFIENVKIYQKLVTEDEASRDLAEFIYIKYTTYKADAMSGLMQMIIRENPNLALLKFPENYFYRLAVIKGSMDLYECYIEEAIELFLKDKDEDAANDCYTELVCVAEKLNDHFFPHYTPCIKGMDFNGVFGTHEKDPEISLILKEDYEIMNDVVEKYNTIIGRRDIIKDLYEKM
jgi:hypothetical protein